MRLIGGGLKKWMDLKLGVGLNRMKMKLRNGFFLWRWLWVRARRVTVDVDGVDRNDSTCRMLIAYYRFKRGGANVRVDLTRRGFHLVAWFENIVDVDYFRCLCGDCHGRLNIGS